MNQEKGKGEGTGPGIIPISGPTMDKEAPQWKRVRVLKPFKMPGSGNVVHGQVLRVPAPIAAMLIEEGKAQVWEAAQERWNAEQERQIEEARKQMDLETEKQWRRQHPMAFPGSRHDEVGRGDGRGNTEEKGGK
jgi:hypothetical protein